MTDPRDNVVRLPRAAPPPIEPFQPFYASQLEGYTPKPREWLIDGVLLRKTISLFAGPPKIGKSLLLQQLLTSVASGVPWLGRAVVQCRAFGLFTEDPDDELCRRQLDINAVYDREPADLELGLSWEAREGKDALLVEFERFSDRPKFTALWHQLWDFVREEEISVIGIDTAAVVFGGNENFRGQVTSFMRELVRMANIVNGAIVLTAHPSKTGPNSYSGSTAWLGSARFGMSLGRPADYDPEVGPHHRRVLRGLGANYGAGLVSERIEYQDGVFVHSDPEFSGRGAREPLTTQERLDLRYRLLMGLKRVLLQGARVPADTMAPSSMPNRARRSPDPLINRVPLNDLYQAQDDLIEAGQVVRVDVGRKMLLRPADGPYYDSEQPWIPATAPGSKAAL
jgi:hypothetical protein